MRTSSPIPLRSPSPHTLLTTLSDPLHLRHPASLRRSQSADQQRQQERPSSSSSCHASLPLPPKPAPGTHSPSRRKLPAIPAGAANAKFPSVIRITRAQLQQVMSPSRCCNKKQTPLSFLFAVFFVILSFLFFFCLSCLFWLLCLVGLFFFLSLCCCQAALSRKPCAGHCAGQTEHGSDCVLVSGHVFL